MAQDHRLPPLTRRFTDESDARVFRFTFYCDRCGRGFSSVPLPFSLSELEGKLTPIQKLIRQAEYDDAYERANRRAMSCFSRCGVCGQMVCPDCEDETAERPLCRGCGKASDPDEAAPACSLPLQQEPHNK